MTYEEQMKAEDKFVAEETKRFVAFANSMNFHESAISGTLSKLIGKVHQRFEPGIQHVTIYWKAEGAE